MKKCYLLCLALCLSLFSLTAQVTDVVTGLSIPYGLVFNGSDLIVSQYTGAVISQFDVNEATPMLETVFSGVTNPTAMILNGNELIYARGNGNAGIFKIDLTEENPTPVSILENAGLSLITSLLLDGDILYIADRDNGRVYSLDLSQASPTLTEIASGFNVPTGVVKQGDLLYVLSRSGGSLSTVDLSVSPAVVSTYLTGLNLPVGLVRDGSFLYIAEDDKVSRVDLNQPTPSTQLVTDGVSAPGLVAFNGLDLYITERTAGKIVKLAISTPTFSTQPTICLGSDPESLGGASPAGGVYSGPNVTDNGDGNTFSFDAATAGVGMHTITYTIDGAMVTGTVTVAESPMFDLGPDLFPPTTSECYPLDGTATGGSGDFSYIWPELGFTTTNLTLCPFADGFISLTVTDNVSGCQTSDTVFYTFTTISLEDVGPFCLDAGVQAGLSGGSPTGGVYSGNGVTDDGNGMTFSFNPAAAGVGVQTITYTPGIGSTATATVEVFALPTVTFSTGELSVQEDAGVQAGLSGGMPTGGVYSGNGVTDDGNGMTYSFDPAAAGLGENVITYTYSDANGCSGNQAAVITVTPAILPGDLCADAININNLFGQAANEPQLSGDYDFANLNDDPTDPNSNGCFGDFSLADAPSVWFSFTGDGNTYTINSTGNADPFITLYTGECGSLTEVICNDDASDLNFSVQIETVIGVEYILHVGLAGEQIAPFNIEVTLQCPEITFTPTLTGVCADAGVQAGLGGGLPEGGVYSGPGITDDGNGMTFSFDPTTAGVGAQMVTYTVTESNIDQEQTSTVSSSFHLFGDATLSQTFIPSSTEICGASVLITNDVAGDVTIELRDALPGSGTTLASGTSTASPNAFVDVSWPSVAVIPGNIYYLVFTSSNGTMQMGGSTTNTYASGNAYYGAILLAELDAAFQTFTCSTGACSGEATASIEVFALPEVTFVPSISTVALNAGTQSISGGMPVGGVYSGNGVTDDGNGMTFSFDPAAAGVGENVITYSFTDANGCSGTQGAVVTVEDVMLTGDVCADANDINNLFGGAVNEAQISSTQDNTGYDAENDPGSGYDCWFGDAPVLNNTIWYAFTGDGEKYSIRSIQCDTINPMTNTDTQFALYSGDCLTPTAVACNDDEDFDNQVYNSYLEITTEPGVDYLLMVDGYVAEADYAAIGTFCLEVTRLETVGVTDISQTPLSVYPNPTTGLIQISSTAEQVDVFDNMGRLVQTYGPATQEVDLTQLPAGLYILQMQVGEEVISARVVKE